MKPPSPKRLWASALAALFLAAHLAFLPPTLEDVDSLNFALGLHDFDPARHQPHPPGYPLFMALAKTVRVVVPSDARALAALGAVFGALAVFPLMALFEAIDGLDPRRRGGRAAALAAVVTLASPLFWFNALRPLSDVPGLAVILAAQAVLAAAYTRQRAAPDAAAGSARTIAIGAFLSALAIGFRSQALFLTLPLLLMVIVRQKDWSTTLSAAMAFAIGILLWGVPLVIATGGPSAYLHALLAQGGEDFSGVDMLYRNPGPRRLAVGLLQTFIDPWASPALGWVVFGLAAAGMATLSWRAMPAAMPIVVLAVPYALFHLVFQETVTTRYALPLVPVVAFLAIKAMETAGDFSKRIALDAAAVGAAALAIWSLAVTLPAVRVYARASSPAFAALEQLHQALRDEPGAAIGMHEGLLRPVQTQQFPSARVLKAPPMKEWLELGAYWRAGNTAPVWFLADPARTDLELIDPLSRSIRAHYIWNFPRQRFISGVRPDIVDLVRIESPPGWFGEQGWHLTSETLNMSERLGTREAVAYVKNRPGPALLVLGGENAGGPAQISLVLGDRSIARWEIPAGGRFFRKLLLPAGSLAGAARFSRLVVSYAAPDGTPQRVRLTAFALEPPDATFFVQDAGWNEIEYSRNMQRRWRWTSERASTFVNAGGRDATITIAGESPLLYFDAPPHVVVRAGERVLARAEPSSDFEITVKVDAQALAASDGMVTIETDRTFVPGDRSGSPDQRRLGLRIFRFEVR